MVAARGAFAEWGYHGATTAAIAKRADISQSYIYALFPSKKDLFLACQRWNHRQLLDIIDAAPEAITPLEAQASIRQACVEKDHAEIERQIEVQRTACANREERAQDFGCPDRHRETRRAAQRRACHGLDQ